MVKNTMDPEPLQIRLHLSFKMGVLTGLQPLIFQDNAGYNAMIFLGDFSKDNIWDILVSNQSGGSGGYGFFYIYSFINNIPRLLFDFEKYNNDYTFNVNYEDLYKVSVGSPSHDKLFTLDISYKGFDKHWGY
jgi:hypothetical protein